MASAGQQETRTGQPGLENGVMNGAKVVERQLIVVFGNGHHGRRGVPSLVVADFIEHGLGQTSRRLTFVRGQ